MIGKCKRLEKVKNKKGEAHKVRLAFFIIKRKFLETGHDMI